MRGGCHCGAVEVVYRTEIPVEKWAPRACQCSFCRKHGARNVSDPSGQLEIRGATTRYRFALRTADFLFCPSCGCYVACVIEHQGRWFGSVNLQVLDGVVDVPDAPCVYDGENVEQRIQRRITRWTPTIFGPSDGAVAGS